MAVTTYTDECLHALQRVGASPLSFVSPRCVKTTAAIDDDEDAAGYEVTTTSANFPTAMELSERVELIYPRGRQVIGTARVRCNGWSGKNEKHLNFKYANRFQNSQKEVDSDRPQYVTFDALSVLF